MNINLSNSEAALRKHQELESELKLQPDTKVFGTSFFISVG